MTAYELKQKRQKDTEILLTQCGVFWAFGKKQLEEGYAKAKLTMTAGDKLIDIGAGGFMPKSNKDTYIHGMRTIGEEFDKAMQDEKTRKDYILYELHNHEAFYTGSLSSTLDALGEGYTREEVQAVARHHNKNKCGCNG